MVTKKFHVRVYEYLVFDLEMNFKTVWCKEYHEKSTVLYIKGEHLTVAEKLREIETMNELIVKV